MKPDTDYTIIKDGHPWSPNDTERFCDMKEKEQTQVKAWIRENIKPRKTPMFSSSSYGLKHRLERDTGIHTTNNEFKGAMLACGYKPVNPDELNWYYCISRKSPCFKKQVRW